MYKVMIVEDELLVRMGLKSSILWDKFNMSVTSEAVNGYEAWENFQKDTPDIVITDLKMPILDGMSLIKKIRDVDKTCRIIILTCVEEFEDARKAILYGVSDYILKLGMTWNDIEAVLSKVQTELDGAVKDKKQTGDNDFRSGAKKDTFLKCLLDADKTCLEELVESIPGLNMKLAPEHIVVCTMFVDTGKANPQTTDSSHKRIMNLSILGILNEEFKRADTGEVFCENERKFIILLNAPLPGTGGGTSGAENWMFAVRDTLLHLDRVLKMYINTTAFWGISSVGNGYASLRQLYHEAEIAMEARFFCPNQNMFFYKSGANYNNMPVEAYEQLVLKIRASQKLTEAYEKGFGELKSKIRDYFTKNQVNEENVRCLFYKLAGWAVAYVDIAGEAADNAAYQYMNDIFGSSSLDAMIANCIRYFDNIASIKADTRKYSRELSAVLNYIDKHYAEDITLNAAAAKVNISQGYLCSIFKKELGMGFTDYILNARINEAKKLLSSSYLRLYEISGRVGFSDYSYFSRVFKKLTGMRPQVYRDKWGMTIAGDEIDEID
jgi:two-component system response regulator YesN